MSQKHFEEDTYDTGLAPRAEAPPLQPQQYQPQPPQQPAHPQQSIEQRSRILKAPLCVEDTLAKLR